MNRTPDLSPRRQRLREARDERLARALRDNLRRRKEQGRTHAAAAGGSGGPLTSLSGDPLSIKSTDDGGTTTD
jgi:hypothetical protein